MNVAPFPFESLPKLTKADLAAQTRARDLVAHFGGAVAHALGETLKVPVSIRPARGAASERPVSVMLALREHMLGIDVETALAREVVARALSHPAGIDAGKAPTPALSGAFAAVLVHALRKAGVAAQVSKPFVERDGSLVALAVTVAGATFHASVLAPSRMVATPALGALEFPVTLPLVAISCLASRTELAALANGDVFLPPGLLKESAVAFVAPRSEQGIAAELTPERGVVIRKGRVATHSWEPAVSERSETNNATLEVALDAPVVVRVELGAVEMKAREWAALAEGDVITLQRKLGEPAILRIAGSEVARGELVQVDGEYGIRITSTHR